MQKYWKYSATGNDFLVFDDRKGEVGDLDWAELCDRDKGIGADGILLLGASSNRDFRMTYLNADGGEVEMCGNGGRAISHFALNILGITPKNKSSFEFETLEGVYSCQVSDDFTELNMTEFEDWKKIDISKFYNSEKSLYVKTGVPHCIYLTTDIDSIELDKVASPIRYNEIFSEGCNINFIEKIGDHHIKMRTYERGVEGETLACGTGATAAALACEEFFGWKDIVKVDAPGGKLEIKFQGSGGVYTDLYLCGEVEMLSSGEIK